MSNDYCYGEAGEVAERLMSSTNVELTDVVGALANAMRRIDHLESEVQELRERADQPDYRERR